MKKAVTTIWQIKSTSNICNKPNKDIKRGHFTIK